MAGDSEMTIPGIIDSIRTLHDRFQGNHVLRRLTDRTLLEPELKVRLEDLFEDRNLSVDSSQQVSALYQGIEALMSHCRIVREEILPSARRAAASRLAIRGMDPRSQVLLRLTLQVLPLTIREYCDRLTDLAVAVRRQDIRIHGESAALISRFPEVPRGLRDLVDWTVQ